MRCIDADALKEKIDSMWNGRPLSSLGARILVTIDDAPSIDAVELGVDYILDFYDVNYKSWRDEDGVEHMRTFCIERKEK